MSAYDQIQPIPTTYRGTNFRSRLEARWAVFMDTAGVEWVYEPKLYDLGNGTRYLPDFWVPGLKAHIEVKPPHVPREAWEKTWLLSSLTQLPVYVLHGCDDEVVFQSSPFAEQATAVFPNFQDEHYMWCSCPHCGRVDMQFGGRADRISCSCPKSRHGDKGYNYESSKLAAAYENAVRHRFTL